MKHIIFSLLFLSSFSSYSQSLDITGNNSVSANPCMQAHSTLTVKNISNSSLDILCEKIIIDTAAGTSNFFCWAANCYGQDTYISPATNTIGAGQADATDFGGYYDAYCDPASASVQYCFYPDNDPADASCITIVYNGSTSSVHESFRALSLTDFYPNPSNNQTSISYVASKNSFLEILDVFGKRVANIPLDYSGSLTIDTDKFKSGIYFANLIVENQKISVKKLVVN